MQIDVISIFPQLLADACRYGVLRLAEECGQLQLGLWNPRDYTLDRHRRVDDRPYGGGPGMVMQAGPLSATIDSVRADRPGAPLIYLSPQGERLDQSLVQTLSDQSGLILLAGRYEGIDERLVESRVDRELSIGDYVLAGGEFAALVLIEAIARLLPGVLGNNCSAAQDSFADGLLDCPHYTRPEEFEGRLVPEILLSGDHQQIKRWRQQQSLGRTHQRRPDLLQQLNLSDDEYTLLSEFKLEHMHD